MSDIRMPAPVTDPAGTAYSIKFDPATQIIHTRLTGFWDISILDRFGVDVQKFLVASRQQLGFARVLLDRRDSPVQSAEFAEAIRVQGITLYNPNNYIAVVLASALAQMQLKRIVTETRTHQFMDMGEAEAWLRAQGAAT